MSMIWVLGGRGDIGGELRKGGGKWARRGGRDGEEGGGCKEGG